MKIRGLIMKTLSRSLYESFEADSKKLIELQSKEWQQIHDATRGTSFSKEYRINKIDSYETYRREIPYMEYGDIDPFMIRISKGERNCLWPGNIENIVQTSGTTSGKKYIPLTRASLRSQQKGRLTALSVFSHINNCREHFNGKLLLFSAHSISEPFGNYSTAPISGLLASTIPSALRRFNLPSSSVLETQDFKVRINKMLDEAIQNRMKIHGAVAFPAWFHYFLQELEKRSRESFSSIFPHFQLLSTSGMSIEPYKKEIFRRISPDVKHLETYPTSEGFLGFKTHSDSPGLSVMPNNGVFYEFIKLEELSNKHAFRYTIAEVETNQTYAILVSNHSGLRSFLIGDSVRFISVNPPRMIITGRTNQRISLMSENVSVNDIETCIHQFNEKSDITILEFICFGDGQNVLEQPNYTWILETSDQAADIQSIRLTLHLLLQKINVLYFNYSEEGLINPPNVYLVKPGSLLKFKNEEKALNFQQKPQRILTNRDAFEKLYTYLNNHNLLINP